MKHSTLRDEFAMRAMQPIFNSLEEATGSMLSTIADTYNLGDNFSFEEIVAVMSYKLADAMMEARNARTD